ncbi:TetR/AcrR family transcriptional regulator [Luteipulveratus mongoliensis]|uniref:HTH tetR-type domain-containing protein n=1 Tax=Luteipulveratus mongoliensis TaxID=571913 RepID=A0A0K1JH26_9MICO|nr:TetR/AcrR family transcriptional regulator [Luteipulveratus mongoliensis]AKU15888.1 hypothetical protein VV02_08530 [Luteipulveratus mongoliensis]
MAEEHVLIWDRPERSSRGPAPTFSRAQLARAALRLADAHGIDAVTMRAVAREVGAGSASLYRYVENRDDLVELMIDEAYAAFDLTSPPTGDWLADLLELARQSRRILLDRPWIIDVVATRTPMGPRVVAYLDHALGLLADIDVPAATRLEAVAILSATVRLLVHEEAQRDKPHPGAALQQAGRTGYLMRTAAAGEHPHLARALSEVSGMSPDEPAVQFDRIVRRVLVGLLSDPRDHTSSR